jgi:hypothetical protein
MSEPWIPEPPPEDAPPLPWRCPECGAALQSIRPHEGGWVGWCPDHGMQLGFQRTSDSQEPENPPEEEPDV